MALTENSKKIIVWSTLIGGIALVGYYAYKYFSFHSNFSLDKAYNDVYLICQ